MKRALAILTGKVETVSPEAMRDAELGRLSRNPPKTAAENAFHKFLQDWKENNAVVVGKIRSVAND